MDRVENWEIALYTNTQLILTHVQEQFHGEKKNNFSAMGAQKDVRL